MLIFLRPSAMNPISDSIGPWLNLQKPWYPLFNCLCQDRSQPLVQVSHGSFLLPDPSLLSEHPLESSGMNEEKVHSVGLPLPLVRCFPQFLPFPGVLK